MNGTEEVWLIMLPFAIIGFIILVFYILELLRILQKKEGEKK